MELAKRWFYWMLYHPEFITFYDLCLHILGVPHNH